MAIFKQAQAANLVSVPTGLTYIDVAAPTEPGDVEGGGEQPPKCGSSSTPVRAEPFWLVVSAVIVLLGIGVGYALNEINEPAPFVLAEGVGIFAVFYILAQAIERLLEPLSSWVGGTKAAGDEERVNPPEAKAQRDAAVSAAVNTPTQANADAAAEAQQRVDQARANLAVVLWGVASLLAMLASGWLGVLLLSTIGVQEPGRALDIAVTGLAVGAGTKPLHDLISNIQASKEKKEDPAETNG